MSPTRICDLGPHHWTLRPGPHNALTDVAGVRVGHTTLIAGDGPLHPGRGPVRTGVTVILPHGDDLFQEKVSAAVHTINGFGKACGFEQVRELGVLETPIALTNTLNVWLVADALAQAAVQQNPAIGIHTSTVNPVVGECNDGYLNDIQGRHVRAEHLGRASHGEQRAGAGRVCWRRHRHSLLRLEGRHWHGQPGCTGGSGGLYGRGIGASQLWQCAGIDDQRRARRALLAAASARASNATLARLDHDCAGD
jgi:Peptidase family S58